ncbi:rSAM-modified peptide [Flavobacterium sp. LHD-85]|nr:rSAM-modified peptide [Flavobacterium sp. LHD-85]MDQ6528328.1 rSAM-modified peptide [Flavobacterium sp. LHD-85]
MKNSTLTFEDFLLDTISRKEQKTIKGGDNEPLPEPNPGKGNGGNGST